jgi:hypothetical protein
MDLILLRTADRLKHTRRQNSEASKLLPSGVTEMNSWQNVGLSKFQFVEGTAKFQEEAESS